MHATAHGDVCEWLFNVTSVEGDITEPAVQAELSKGSEDLVGEHGCEASELWLAVQMAASWNCTPWAGFGNHMGSTALQEHNACAGALARVGSRTSVPLQGRPKP